MVRIAGSKCWPGNAFEIPPQQAGGSVRVGVPDQTAPPATQYQIRGRR